MNLIYLITLMHLSLICAGFLTALFLGVHVAKKEIRIKKIDINFDNLKYQKLLKVVSLFVPEQTISAFIYNNDLFKYLYGSIISGVFSTLLYWNIYIKN